MKLQIHSETAQNVVTTKLGQQRIVALEKRCPTSLQEMTSERVRSCWYPSVIEKVGAAIQKKGERERKDEEIGEKSSAGERCSRATGILTLLRHS